jgi:polyhydroxyalkanoate synthase
MTSPADSSGTPPAGQELAENLGKVAMEYQRLLTDFLQHQTPPPEMPGVDPVHLADAWVDLASSWMNNPSKLIEAQLELWRDLMVLWQNMALRAVGHAPDPVAEPAPGDRRFKADDWTQNQIFDFIKQSYLVTSRWFTGTIRNAEGLDDKTRKKLEFFSKQFVDAMSPSNFVLTNPEVLQETFETGGDNLLRGLKNVLKDLERGKGQLQISMTDFDAFEVGRNVATTPGKVVYQNDIIQLIQYTPTTEQVYEKPLMIIPPWINKYYILDLQPKNSFIRWALEQGYTVFILSWVNPDEHLAKKTFEDYMFEGPLAALDAIEQATGQRSVSAIGYCIGGTLLACTLAYMAEKGDDRINAATFFTAQVDFSEAGDLSVFIDDDQLKQLDKQMSEKGYLEASSMATTFNMLRSNDLIWSFVVNNYLMGKDPMPFDLLYWNSDSTRMPRALHSYYLRKMYHENKLVEPGAIVLGGVPIDLRKIKTPIFIQAGKEDHIAPYTSVFKSVQHFSGPTKFMLAGSGHIAGVINPPAAKKYNYWTNPKNPKDLDKWMEGAVEHPGSWWPDWHNWLSRKSGKKVPARVPGDGKLKVLEDAPGSYVTSSSPNTSKPGVKGTPG